MNTWCTFVLLLPLLRASLAHEVTVQLDELATAVGVEKCRLRPRGHASNQGTVVLYDDEKLIYNFCLKKRKSFSLEKLRYSNDGLSDLLTFHLDDQEVGSWVTREKLGDGVLWNTILEVANFGENVTAEAGNHQLTVKVEDGDQYGVELDSLTFSLDTTDADDDSLCRIPGSKAITPLFGGCDPDQTACGLPPPLPNADVSFKGKYVGATATYTCRPGFLFCGRSTKHRCSSVGEWEGLYGSCYRARWPHPKPGVEFDVSLPWGITDQYSLEIIATLTVRSRFTVTLISNDIRLFYLEVRFASTSSIHANVYLSSGLLNIQPFTLGKQFRLGVVRQAHTFQVIVDGEYIGEQCNTYPSYHTDRLVISSEVTIEQVTYISQDVK
ncbi:uncharacterized protein [Haliotis cracherodii]|uniref:uncharacterized protein n=1 Tax=Haliotis cracherodii TaxID=6455 RepID=UPI0039EC9610